MEKGDIAFRVCSGKIIINRHNFGHKTEIDLDKYLILLNKDGGGGGSRTVGGYHNHRGLR
jgi:hypothetical protein